MVVTTDETATTSSSNIESSRLDKTDEDIIDEKKTDGTINDEATNNNEDNEDEIPIEILKVKEKLERETGKKFKYRPAKKDLPSVGDLLTYGVPKEHQDKDGNSGFWFNLLCSPFGVFLLFVLSLFIFHNTVMQMKPTYVPYKMRQEIKKREQQHLLEMQQQQQTNENENVLGLKQKDEL